MAEGSGQPSSRVSRTGDPPAWLLKKAREHPILYGFPANHVEQKIAKLKETTWPYSEDSLDDIRRKEDRIQWVPGTGKEQDASPSLRPEDLGAIQAPQLPPETAAAASKGKQKQDSMEPSLLPTSVFASEGLDEYPVPTSLPAWYTSIKDDGFEMKQMMRKKPHALTALEGLKSCMKRCEERPTPELFEELRNHIHKAEITLEVTKLILRKSRILHPAHGLPRIFRETEIEFPWDIKADAFQLYSRWYAANLKVDLLRGIVKGKGVERNGDRIDKGYKLNHSPSAKFYGQGHLVPGQWWPTQLCAVRDGAHGAPQGGIFGEKGNGAYSIVLSGGNSYHDTDEGDTIEYSGTEGKDATPSEATMRMIESCDVIKQPVRVLRSSQLNKKNTYRPEVGLRYDGLYEVRSYRLIDWEKAMYRFHLVRCEGQNPIRFEDNATRRPTKFEVQAFKFLKHY